MAVSRIRELVGVRVIDSAEFWVEGEVEGVFILKHKQYLENHWRNTFLK